MAGALCLALLCLAAPGLRAATIPVTDTADSGTGTLRDALANAADGDLIDASGLTGTIRLTSGELQVTNSVAIHGPGADVLSVDGNGISRVFRVTGLNVTLAGLTITNGLAAGEPPDSFGGGLFIDGGTMTISNCVITGNAATFGAGLFIQGVHGNVSLAVVDSTFSGNLATGAGGGLFDLDFVGTIDIRNSTFSGNSATFEGGGIANRARLVVRNSTFSDNSAPSGGAIFNRAVSGPATVEIGGCILNAGSIANQGTVTSLGYNLSSDAGITNSPLGTGGFTATGDQINSDPILGPLQNNGGPTPTHALLCGSPAIDKGKNLSGSATDQRGAPRTFDVAGIANASGGDGTDIGAVESPVGLFTVLNTNDSSVGSLRAAISNANASAGTDLIEFDPSVTGTITLTSGELLITDCLILNGPGATNVAVNGNAANRVFHITPGIHVAMAGLTITNGLPPGTPVLGLGGGIWNESSTLTLSNCIVTGNSASFGGGLYNDGENIGAATMTIVNSTVSGNSVTHSGGGILNSGLAGMTIINTTLSGNFAQTAGGGIWNGGFGSGATLEIVNSTFSGNSVFFAGGSIYNNGTLTIGSTILNAGISGGTITNDESIVISLGYNLSSDDGGGELTAATDLVNTNAMLGPLQLNGGQTPTHALLCGSPAIDAGANLAGSATDQTGAPRTFGAATDIGAFELQMECPHTFQELLAEFQATLNNLNLARGEPRGLRVAARHAGQNFDKHRPRRLCQNLRRLARRTSHKIQNGILTQLEGNALLDIIAAMQASAPCPS